MLQNRLAHTTDKVTASLSAVAEAAVARVDDIGVRSVVGLSSRSPVVATQHYVLSLFISPNIHLLLKAVG